MRTQKLHGARGGTGAELFPGNSIAKLLDKWLRQLLTHRDSGPIYLISEVANDALRQTRIPGDVKPVELVRKLTDKVFREIVAHLIPIHMLLVLSDARF